MNQVKEVTGDAINLFSYCPEKLKKTIQKKIPSDPTFFDALLEDPRKDPDVGIKQLFNMPFATIIIRVPGQPDKEVYRQVQYELKQISSTHGKSRLLGIGLNSDSNKKGKQGKAIVFFKYSENGLHTQEDINALRDSLKGKKFVVEFPSPVLVPAPAPVFIAPQKN